jgi:hypothetical protein
LLTSLQSPLAQELAVCEVEDEDTTFTMDQQELLGAVAAAANVERRQRCGLSVAQS